MIISVISIHCNHSNRAESLFKNVRLFLKYFVYKSMKLKTSVNLGSSIKL